MIIRRDFIYFLLVTFFSKSLNAQHLVTIEANTSVAKVSPTMWGIFFEDINFSADGGLYAELVKNRSFEFPMPMTGWKEIKNNGGNGKILIENISNGKEPNARYAHITVNALNGSYGLSNEGFRGIGFHKNEGYDVSIKAKKLSGDLKVRIEAVNTLGKKIGEAVIDNVTDDWKTYKLSFSTVDSATKGKLNVLVEGKGELYIDGISLFPKNTWMNRPNGLRTDLVQLLADMKPGFIRFPGGCIVEGRELTNRYQWKETVGPVENRKTMVNRWNMEFPHRSTPDYYQSFGLGFFEYFQLAEDIGAEPLPILNCGMACQFNSGEVVAMNELDPYIQDALDLIEFANGSVTTKWGQLRAGMGHPKSFNLKYIGIGNEQWDEQYIERYKQFHAVLKQRYPEIQIVSSVGPAPDGTLFDYAWKELKALNADIVDEHYYASPQWFFKNANRYNNYPIKGPKVFAGEYAAHSSAIGSIENKNNWQCALAEAAFMTGLERNAGVVQMASYAPLLAHIDAWQWAPDLIWFDNLRAVATPNYYVQKLYSTNKGTDVVPALTNGKVLAGQDSIYASAVVDKTTGEVIIKFVNASSKPSTCTFKINGGRVTGNTSMQVLSSSDLLQYNTLDNQQLIYPKEVKLGKAKNEFKIAIEPSSFNVIKIPAKF